MWKSARFIVTKRSPAAALRWGVVSRGDGVETRSASQIPLDA